MVKTAKELRKGDRVTRVFSIRSVKEHKDSGEIMIETQELGGGIISWLVDPERQYEVASLIDR
jgi:hypothetical protein